MWKMHIQPHQLASSSCWSHFTGMKSEPNAGHPLSPLPSSAGVSGEERRYPGGWSLVTDSGDEGLPLTSVLMSVYQSADWHTRACCRIQTSRKNNEAGSKC